MNTLIICATIVACIFIVCYYINKLTDKAVETDSTINSMFDDMATVKEVIDRTVSIECYSDTIKHNILTVKNIVSKYVEELETPDTSSEES